MSVRTFVIAGAPKSATTALAASLARHPEVTFSIPKEPYWFGSDLAPLRRREGLYHPSDYEHCFRHGSRDARWRGDGSTLYLSSPDAIAQLDVEAPDSLEICVVRNPLDVAHSFHMQMVYEGFEPLAEFADAWHARRHRRERPPATCPVPRLLDYDEIAALGTQLERAVNQVGGDRVHVVVYDDLIADPGAVMRGLAARLELTTPLDPPGRVNQAMALRSPTVGRALRSTNGRRLARRAKQQLPVPVARALVAGKDRVLRQSRERATLRPTLREELVAAFAPEVRRLEWLLGRDLGHWLTVASTEPAS
jgi:hypothetical protein